MKAVIKKEPGKGFTIVDLPEPKIENPTHLKLKMIFSGICGTDYHINEWDDWSKENIKTPHINGHEGLGQVVSIGSAVQNFKVGDVVSFETHIYDGTCRICKADGRRVCKNMKILGVSVPGVWREYAVMPANIVFKLDGKVPYKYCAILEPFGNAYHTQSVSEITGKNVLVMGDGPIGVFAALIAKTRNPRSLFVTGINPYREKIIRECGLEFINPMKVDLKKELLKRTNNEGIDVILEFSGSLKAISDAVMIINELGSINILSIYPQQEVPLRMNDLTFKNITINTILGRKIWSTWNEGYQLLKSKKIDWSHIEKIISHRIPFTDFAKGIELIRNKKTMKVQLTFPATAGLVGADANSK